MNDAPRNALGQIEGNEIVARHEMAVTINRRVREAVAAARKETDVETEYRVADAAARAEAALRDQFAAELDRRVAAARDEAYRQGWCAGRVAGLAQAAVAHRTRVRAFPERRLAAAAPEATPSHPAAVRRSENDVGIKRRVRGGEP
jgi:hypothetical protein